MKKLIEISNCYKCHHKRTINCSVFYCDLVDRREIEINIFEEIPEWCPLPNASQPAVENALVLCVENGTVVPLN